MALFPPVKGGGGGAGVAYGHKGKGVTLHTLSDGNGRPLGIKIKPANDHELHQVVPLLKNIKKICNKVPLCLVADKGYDAEWLRYKLTWFFGMGSVISRRGGVYE